MSLFCLKVYTDEKNYGYLFNSNEQFYKRVNISYILVQAIFS